MTFDFCPICGGAMQSFRTADDGKRYYECPTCQWTVLDPVHVLPQNEQRQRYLKHMNSFDNEGYVSLFEGFLTSCVDPFCQPPAQVLDFGCGPGPVLAMLLRRKGYATDTYDPFFSPDESYKTKTYQVITMTEVIEHIQDPMMVLGELRERLSEDGVLSIMTLFRPQERGAFTQWWYRRDPTHVCFLTLTTLIAIGKKLKLRLLYTDETRTAVLGR